MKNRKGFVLLETLIVTVFVVVIFTFLYVSVIPLLGNYDELTDKENIDVVYDLYNLRDALYRDDNYTLVTSDDYGFIESDNLADKVYFDNLTGMFELDRYDLFYVRDLNKSYDTIVSDSDIHEDIRKYFEQENMEANGLNSVIVLFEKNNHSIVHLNLELDKEKLKVHHLATTGSCNVLTYNYNTQTLAQGGHYVTYLNNEQTDAGSYIVTVKANENYSFPDGSLEKTLTCDIKRLKTSVMGSCNNLTYNKTSQTLVSGGEYVEFVDNNGINSQNYTVTVKSDKNHLFTDGTELKTITCNIKRKTLYASNFDYGPLNKTYDRTTSVPSGFKVAATQASGLISGDIVNVSYSSAAYNNSNVNSANSVIVSGISISGNNNYQLDATSYTKSGAIISKKTLDVSKFTYSPLSKVYDGSTSLPSGFSIASTSTSGLISGDSVNVNYSSGSFNTANTGSVSVVISGMSVSGASAANYQLSTTSYTKTGGSITINQNPDLILKNSSGSTVTGGSLTYGTSITLPITKSGDGTLSCSSSNTSAATCSISGSNLIITPKASASDGVSTTIKVSLANGTNYAAKSISYTATVNRSTIACPESPSAKTYNGSSQASGITCPTGSSVGGTASAVNAGSYTHSCIANAGYKFASACNVVWKINRKDSSSSLASTSGALTYGTNKTVAITTSGDGAITCSSSNTAVATCSVSGKTLTIVPKATASDGVAATIIVNVAAGTNYNASAITFAATVNRLTIACPGSPSAKTYNGSSQVSGITCPTGSSVGGTASATNAGEYIHSCIASAGYKFASACNVSWKINKIASSVSCKSLTYTGSSQTLATGSGCSSLSGNSGTNAGSYTVTCNGDANHNNSSATCSIGKATASITCSNKTYNGSAQTACSCSGGTIGGTYSATAAGTYTATCTGDGNHSNATSKSWTMSKAASSISCKSLTYTGSSQTLATGTGCASFTNNSATNAGSYTVTCNGDANHNSSATSCSIGKATASITCSNKTYNGSAQTACSCSGGTIGGTYSATAAGTYTATCTGDSNHSNATSKSWTMSKAASSISCKSLTYTGSAQTLATGSGCSSLSGNSGTNAGSYTVTCNGDANHNNSSATCSIGKATASITCSNKTYNGSAQTACSCSGGTIGGTYSATAAGTYTATCTGDGNHSNATSKSWTMSKAASSISCKSLTYTGSSQTLATGTGCASFTNNSATNAGSYTVTCNGDANHNSSATSCSIGKATASITCSNKYYNQTGQTGCTCSGGTIGGTYSATKVGTYTASCAGDSNHNNAANKSWQILADNVAPTCSVSKTVTGANGVSVSVTCSDSESGCSTGTQTGTGLKSSTTYTVYDKAGNKGTCTASISATCTKYMSCQNSACTCSAYKRCSSAGCETRDRCSAAGCETYKSCSVCTKYQAYYSYTTKAGASFSNKTCGSGGTTKSAAENYCGSCISGACSTNGCKSSSCSASCSSSVTKRDSSCGCETYKRGSACTCATYLRGSVCGCETYNSCENSSCGCSTYNYT